MSYTELEKNCLQKSHHLASETLGFLRSLQGVIVENVFGCVDALMTELIC
jgi:hypothetical protein